MRSHARSRASTALHLVRVLIPTILVGACTSAVGTPVTIREIPVVPRAYAELTPLEGEWIGQLHDPTGARDASVAITLTATGSVINGDVVLTTPTGINLRAAENASTHFRHAKSMETLRLTLVPAEHGALSGTLEPYFAPDCLCTVSMSVRGELAGDHLTGTFRTYVGGAVEHRGTWDFERVKVFARKR